MSDRLMLSQDKIEPINISFGSKSRDILPSKCQNLFLLTNNWEVVKMEYKHRKKSVTVPGTQKLV